PFCVKVEIFLRKYQIPYRVITEKNPARGPKGKMPFIVDGKDIVADSTFSLLHLEKAYAIPAELSPEQQAVCLAFQRLIEENLYFVLLYSRWVDPAGWETVKKEFIPMFPTFLGLPILYVIRGQLKRQAVEQGIGRHSLDEVYEIGLRDMNALAHFLGDKKYFLGETFSCLDASAYAFLITILKQPIESKLKACLMSHENLLRYCREIEAEFFPELVKESNVRN
ncbi:MAG: glutathione S-transferase family protein, partial [Bdellovibrionota bacterium]